jgi:hypothetical protein
VKYDRRFFRGPANDRLTQLPLKQRRSTIADARDNSPSCHSGMSWSTFVGETMGAWDLGFVVALMPWLARRAASLHYDGIAASDLYYLPQLITLSFQLPPHPSLLDDGTPRPLQNCLGFSHDGTRILPIYPISPDISSAHGFVEFSLSVWAVEHSHPDPRSRVKDRGRLSGVLPGRLPVARSLLLVSFLLTIGIFAYAAVKGDRPAILGLALVTLSSVARSYYHWFRFRRHVNEEPRVLIEEEKKSPIPVIAARSADAILVLLCDTFGYQALVTGRLNHYSPVPSIHQPLCCNGPRVRLPAAIYCCTVFGRISLCLGCLFLANSSFIIQLAVSAAYILLTLLFFLCPPDVDAGARCLTVTRQYHHAGAADAHRPQPNRSPTEVQPSLARTLWYAIRATGSTAWVSSLIAACYTKSEEDLALWREWIREAQLHISDEWWPAEGEKKRLVDGDEHVYDHAAGAEEAPNREPSLEITPVPVSQW